MTCVIQIVDLTVIFYSKSVVVNIDFQCTGEKKNVKKKIYSANRCCHFSFFFGKRKKKRWRCQKKKKQNECRLWRKKKPVHILN